MCLFCLGNNNICGDVGKKEQNLPISAVLSKSFFSLQVTQNALILWAI